MTTTTPFHPSARVAAHPLLDYHLARLREESAGPEAFRTHVIAAARVLAVEAVRDLPTVERAVRTPLEVTTGRDWARPLVLVPILRAGLGLLHGFLEVLPWARVGHLGMARDEETLQPTSYFSRLPDGIAEADVIVLDPMLATGGSGAAALAELRRAGARHLKFCCLVATPEGLQRMGRDHSDIPVLAGALDRGLNEHGFILPGLGDAGDRYFGT